MESTLTTTFIEKAKAVHGDQYDYSKVNYTHSKVKVTITCLVHGDYSQTPKDHLRGRGCPECGRNKTTTHNTMNTATFIEKARTVHGDRYDYSKVEYTTTHAKVTITCPEHGDFLQRPSSHLQGMTCPKCAIVVRTSKNTPTYETFLLEARTVHGDRYAYDNTTYKNYTTPMVISCPVHGDYFQTPRQHLLTAGCSQCSTNSRSTHSINSTADLVQVFRTVHGDKYDYSKVEYTTRIAPVIITCPEHGDFSQITKNHYCGMGCPYCVPTTSKGEIELLDFIKSSYSGTILTNTRAIIPPLEVDTYLPDLRLAIEFNGGYWHSESHRSKFYHYEKYSKLQKAGVRLITVWDWEWDTDRDKLKSYLRNILTTSTTVRARTLTLAPVPIPIQRSFLQDYHLQGYVPSTVMLGLWKDSELIQVMGLGRKNKGTNTWEITRLCTKVGHRVTGGSKKLYSALLKLCTPATVFSYNNLDKFSGLVYSELGLQYSGVTIGYGWYRHKYHRSRYSTQKHKLLLEGCPHSVSESTWMQEQGWVRVWYTGTTKYSATYSY